MKLVKKIINRIKLKYYNRTYEGKVKYLRSKGAKIGKNLRLNCDASCFGTEPYLIEVGDNCLFASGVRLTTHDGGIMVLNNLNKFEGKKMDKMIEIKIGSNVYIGMNAMVMQGVTVGDNVIIGAGAIVTKDIPSNSVAVGIPARVIKTVDEYYENIKENGGIYSTIGLSWEEKRKYYENVFKK